VFDASVFVFNAGHLPDTWTVETLFEKHGSEPRNPLVAAAIFRTGMIETWGRGIEKMLAGCERIGAPNPIFKPIGKDMSVEFSAPYDAIYHRDTDKTGKNTDKTGKNTDRVPINEREKTVLDFIDAHGGIANRDAQELLGLGDSSIKKLFQRMSDSFQIEAIGEKKIRVYRRLASRKDQNDD
jgi:ATP-dependent DNA helicase RecG